MLTVEAGETTKGRSWVKWVVVAAGVLALVLIPLIGGRDRVSAEARATCESNSDHVIDGARVDRLIAGEVSTAGAAAGWMNTRGDHPLTWEPHKQALSSMPAGAPVTVCVYGGHWVNAPRGPASIWERVPFDGSEVAFRLIITEDEVLGDSMGRLDDLRPLTPGARG